MALAIPGTELDVSRILHDSDSDEERTSEERPLKDLNIGLGVGKVVTIVGESPEGSMFIEEHLEDHPTIFKGTRSVFQKPLGHSGPPRLKQLDGYIMIKGIDTTPISKIRWERETQVYAHPSIKECPHIRKYIKNFRVGPDRYNVFEWMDGNLMDPKNKPSAKASLQARTIARSVLKALEVIHSFKNVHRHVCPSNIFVSNFHGSNPIVKLGDLGTVNSEAHLKKRMRIFWETSIMFRAPEGYRGLPLSSKNDIWALGVTLVSWLTRLAYFHYTAAVEEKLRNSISFFPRYANEMSIARIVCLRGGIGGLPEPSLDEATSEMFHRGMEMATGKFVDPETKKKVKFRVRSKTLREELERIPGRAIEPGFIEFVECLLNLDPDSRPSASEALQHPWLQDSGGNDSKENTSEDTIPGTDAPAAGENASAEKSSCDNSSSEEANSSPPNKEEKSEATPRRWTKRLCAKFNSKVKFLRTKMKRGSDTSDSGSDAMWDRMEQLARSASRK